MRKAYVKSVIFLMALAFVLVSLVGCNRTEVKGIREKGAKSGKGEPTVVVVDKTTGQNRTMKLEAYIAAVVAGEMKVGWPENAYAAQAIIARTFTMEYMKRKNTNRISADFEEAQAFKPEQVSDVIRRATKKTRGEVAMYQNQYIRAWFHSSAAGQTTTAKAGLAFTETEPPYIVSVKSPDELAPAEIKNWSVTFDSARLATAVAETAGVKATRVTDIKIIEKDPTGRATKMQIAHDGTTTIVEAPKFRNELDPMVLKSTLIKGITRSGNSFTFSGSGFGHGVGMSQWGANKLAADGRSPEEIVKYYFRNVTIEKAY